MKRRASTSLYAAGAAVTAGLLILGTSWAQEARPKPRPEREYQRRPAEVIMNRYGDNPFEYRQKFDVVIHNPEAMGAIREAAERLRDAEGDDERETAKDRLSKILDEFFENDMQRRADELAKIEERVKKLHSLMERRAAKKQEIIDLQIKVLENEADGLGFFSEPGPPTMDQQGGGAYGGGGFGGSGFGVGGQGGSPMIGIRQKEMLLRSRQPLPADSSFGPPIPPPPPRAGEAPGPLHSEPLRNPPPPEDVRR